jgi:hypothetical protein
MSSDRFKVNDALSALAYQFGVDPSSFDSEQEYDDWLNELTHHVADQIDTAGTNWWEVYDHVTGVAFSKPYARHESASQICSSFNTPTAGGRYGVRPVPAPKEERA